MLSMEERAQTRGSLLGLAVGDALGAPLEYAADGVAAAAADRGLEMSGGGRWRAGEWTDDTSLALALAESIAEHGLLDVEDVVGRYVHWATSDGKGIGRATRAALTGGHTAQAARHNAWAYQRATGMGAGNGTVMRCAPIGLAAPDVATAVLAARADAQLTHAHPAAAAASAALCAALVAVRDGDDPLAAAELEARAEPDLARALSHAAGLDEAALRSLATGPCAGACFTTLAIALAALLYNEDYESGVSWAISLGGDADTNGAVAGALLGLRHGVNGIPARWLEPLHDRERIAQAAYSLLPERHPAQ
jgi:ADP-ribosyl-[dinitrogen reductase] hydrolase